jgi:hypothetical protein
MDISGTIMSLRRIKRFLEKKLEYGIPNEDMSKLALKEIKSLENIIEFTNMVLNNFSIDDFHYIEDTAGGKVYVLNRHSVILGKLLISNPLIHIHESNNISDYIPKINEYIKWLGRNKLKKALMDKFCEINTIVKVQDLIKENWYEELEVRLININVEKYGELSSNITFFEKYKRHIGFFELTIEDKKIVSLSIKGTS